MSEAITEIKESKTYQIAGVGVIILLPSGEILAVQEMNDSEKTGKEKGDWSIPMESIEEGETIDQNFKRLFREEILAFDFPQLLQDNKQWLGDYEVVPGIWGRVFVLKVEPNFVSYVGQNNSDVTGHSFVNPGWLLSQHTRAGVEEMIKDFLSNKERVVRPHTLIKKPAHHT